MLTLNESVGLVFEPRADLVYNQEHTAEAVRRCAVRLGEVS